MAAATATTLLRLADAVRKDPSKASRLDLWRLADREAASVPAARVALYRHALIHAGVLTNPRTKRPYTVCRMCKARL